MMLALIFIAAGLCLLGLLFFVFLRIETNPSDNDDPAATTSMLAAEAVLWSQQLGTRIFSQGDLEFIVKEVPSFRKTFLRERRGVALSWIAQRRNAARSVIRLHRAVVRANIALSPVLEFKLAANYFVFLVACAVAESLVILRGPFAAREEVSRLVALGAHLRPFSESLLETLEPVRLGEIRNSQSQRN